MNTSFDTPLPMIDERAMTDEISHAETPTRNSSNDVLSLMKPLSWLTVFLVLLLFLLPTVVADDDDDDEDGETILGIEAEGLGDVALYLMIGSLLIVVWKPAFSWLRKHGPERFDQEPREFKRRLGLFHRKFMKVHVWIGFATALVGTIHGIFLEWHWTLWVGMGAVWILVLSGSMMQWRWPPKKIRRGTRLLHMQRTLSVVAVVLLLIGHGIVD